jgi:methylenetetrahydrofolate dehydrogenase (NADP+)/methenyltetrahydrofolate cyclohydrolase
MQILDGRKLSKKILSKIKKEISSNNRKIKLGVFLVGGDPASQIYVSRKGAVCGELGIGFKLHRLPSTIKKEDFKKELLKAASDGSVSGIMIQLPLPKHLNSQDVFDLIPPKKDVDVLSALSLGKFYTGDERCLPPVVGTVKHFLKEYKISVAKKNVVLVGAGRLVGFPLSLWLFRQKATVSVVNEFTKNAASYLREADVIISGVGKPGFIKGNMVKKNVVVIDVGISRKGKNILGDIEFVSVSKKASHITPVPGGVGPMTIACLIDNLITLNQ